MSAESVSATQPDLLNQTLFIADNLNLLRSIDNETVDLICTDPPFDKNDTFIGNLQTPLTDEEMAIERDMLAKWGILDEYEAEQAQIVWPDTERAEAKFKDIWKWDTDVHEDWVNRIEADFEGVAWVIEAARTAHGEERAAYLTYMAIRIIEMQRILKPTGSLYLHCDPTASHYLKAVIDAIMGQENFRNEIIWRIGWVSGFKTQKRGWIRNHDIILYYVKSQEAIKKFNKEYIPYPEGYVRRDGKAPTGKGIPIEDTWNCSPADVLDSIMIKSFSREKTGYPTQKPVALAERIVKASSEPGDLVFDPFAGCAYVPVAAERNGRKWIACDISPRALTILRRQFHKFEYAIEGEQGLGQQTFLETADVTIRSPHELPKRTDEDPEPVITIKPLPERKYKVPASIIPEREMLKILLEMSGYMAWCCGFANRTSSGEIVKTTNNFHLDHIDPKSRDGSNQIINRAPMCPTHNIRKGKRRISLDEYRKEIAEAGELLVPSIDDLISLPEALQKSLDEYTRWRTGAQHSLDIG